MAGVLTATDLTKSQYLVVTDETGKIVSIVFPNDVQVGTRTVGANLHVSGVLTVGSGTVKVTSNDVQFGSPSNRVELASGNNLKFYDTLNAAGVTLATLVSGSGAPTGSSYVVMALDASLTAERRLQVSADLSLTDGGANGDVTLGVGASVYKSGGTDVAVADGGTGASTVGVAQDNLATYPRLASRAWGAICVGATTARNDTGAIASASAGTAGAVANGVRRYVRYTSAASNGSTGEVHSNGYDLLYGNRGDWTCSFRFATGGVITVCRYWIVVTSGTPTNSDTLPGHGFGLRYSTAAGDTGFMLVARDGTTQAIGAQINTIVASTDYVVDLKYTAATNTYSVRVNSGAWTDTTTNVPSATQQLGPFHGVMTLEAGAKAFDHAWIEYTAPA